MMSHKSLSLKDYANIYAAIHHAGVDDDNNYLKNEMVSNTLTQYHVSKGLKIYGEKGVDAVLKEQRQQYARMFIKPDFANSMSEKKREDAIQYLMFLKEKRNGTIKGRGCADSQKQRIYISKDEASAQTVSTEALLLSCLIDASEGPGAFMKSDM